MGKFYYLIYCLLFFKIYNLLYILFISINKFKNKGLLLKFVINSIVKLTLFINDL